MTLPRTFIPVLPFPNFKWKWACLQCTEGINDPVVLLGVLFRMRHLENENRGLRYSSPEFAEQMQELSRDLENSGVNVNIAGRTGERNLIRNSGQYWKALGLIPVQSHGVIELTSFGKRVADRDISQSEFAATTIQTFSLPNSAIQSSEECNAWQAHHLHLYPLRLLLEILRDIADESQKYITKDELIKIIIPLSSYPNATVEDYVNFIHWYREEPSLVNSWPNCCPSANDHRIAREFLLFLSNYGYLEAVHVPVDVTVHKVEQFKYNMALDDEIRSILSMPPGTSSIEIADAIHDSDVTSDIERIRVQANRRRPNQARFRRDILGHYERCIITNVTMPEVLEAAHIKPYKYHGEDTAANGFCLRMDIHQLFDAGHLRIAVNGEVHLSGRARQDYGALIPPRIFLPEFVNLDFVRWRWENYNGL